MNLDINKLHLAERYKEALKEVYHDEDGWWAVLKAGWGWGADQNGTIHEETRGDLLREIRTIEKI